MDGSWSPELAALQAEAHEVGRRAAHGLAVLEDPWINGFSAEFSEELGRRGWLGMTWPVEEGGHGRSPLERFVVTEALLAEGAPVAASWFADRQIGPSLLAFGSPEQRRRFLPEMVAGRAGWCIGMSEPDHGSDLAHLATRARRDGDTFVVTGRKVWTSFATTARWCYLICRTDPDAPAHRGLSELIVDMASPGIEVRPIRDMAGGAHFCEVTFDEVRVPGDHLVGELHGSWRQTMSMLEHERGGPDRLLSNRALYRDVRPLADLDDPVVRQEVAALETGYRVGRLLVLRGVLGPPAPGWSAATKAFCTRFEQRVARFCTAVAGPAGLLTGPAAPLGGRIARNACYAPAYGLMGGTDQILRTIVGERTLELPR